MIFDPTVVSMAVRAEHELRVRTAERARKVEAALRSGHGRTERVALRRRAGNVLVDLGHRVGGTPPLATGNLGRVAG